MHGIEVSGNSGDGGGVEVKCNVITPELLPPLVHITPESPQANCSNLIAFSLGKSFWEVDSVASFSKVWSGCGSSVLFDFLSFSIFFFFVSSYFLVLDSRSIFPFVGSSSQLID